MNPKECIKCGLALYPGEIKYCDVCADFGGLDGSYYDKPYYNQEGRLKKKKASSLNLPPAPPPAPPRDGVIKECAECGRPKHCEPDDFLCWTCRDAVIAA
jgi:hypothetical protein